MPKIWIRSEVFEHGLIPLRLPMPAAEPEVIISRIISNLKESSSETGTISLEKWLKIGSNYFREFEEESKLIWGLFIHFLKNNLNLPH